MNAVNKPVSNITVKGQFHFLEKNDIEQLVLSQIDGKFLEVDLQQLRLSLESEPWVKQAEVQRIWPDGLFIEIQEQTPVARWRDSGFINNLGDVVDISDNSRLANLPLFSGPEAQRLQVARTYLEVTEMLRRRGFELQGVNVDATLAWQITLKSGVELVFGQYDVMDKLRSFLVVYEEHLQALGKSIRRVDMRYEKGMAVAWRGGPEEELQASR